MNTNRDCFVFDRIKICWMLLLVSVLGCSAESSPAIKTNDNRASEISTAVSSDRKTTESEVTREERDTLEPENHSDTPTDESYRQLILGTWQDEYQGKRFLTVREDGTATMLVQPNGLAAKLFAERMMFEETWHLEAGQVTFHAVGGEPAGRVNLILQTMGDSSHYQIMRLTQEQMLLQDADGQTTYDWRRVDDK